MMYRYWDRTYDMMGSYTGWWFFLKLGAFLAIVFLAIFLIRHFMKNGSRYEVTPSPSPLDIAKTRLAKGEITPEEFAALKEHLNS